MPLVPIAPPPGLCLSASSYGAGKDASYTSSGAGSFRQGSGRWTTANNVEFIAGFPQKVAGWAQASASATTGTPRAMKIWRDKAGDINVGIGTDNHLYYLLNSTLTDITPVQTQVTSTLTNALTTVNGSPVIAVADNAQVLQNGDRVFLSASAAIGGITLNGWYPVSGRSGTGYNITYPIAANAGTSSGGGTISYQYPRVTLSNPFATTSGSKVVTVTHASSVASQGGFVVYSGASAVGGLTLNGEYQIQSIVDSSHYTIQASANASSTVASGGGSVSVIYPIVVQQATSNQGVGYGGGAYGIGAYSLGLNASSVLHDGWTLDAYGYQLIGAPVNGTIYVWDPVYAGRAYPLLNAPAAVLAMFVTPERFVVALGINGNYLQMAWCDQNDYTVWTTTATNTANTGRTLIGGSFFVGGIAIRDGISLIFTDRCVFQMNYVGGQEIYSTPQIGDNCGLVDPTAVAVEGGIAYWMSDQDFWSYNGSVTVLNTDDVRAYIFQSGYGILNRQYLTSCTGMMNRAKRQMRWFFPSGSSTEPNVGVIYQYDQQCFTLTTFGRTCGADANLLPTPVSADTSGYIYYDETGTDANGTPLSYALQLSDMDVSNGDKNADIFGLIPDFQYLNGGTDLFIFSSYYPDQSNAQDGPYVINGATGRQDFRVDGKLFGFSIEAGALGANFRLGVPRLDVSPSGSRR